MVITGSGRGIGRSIAIACAKEGANLGLTSNVIEEIENVKKEIENLGLSIKVCARDADVTKFSEVESLFKFFSEELGLLDGVIANAGYSRMGISHEFDSDTFSSIISINILGVFNTFKGAYQYLNKEDKKAKARFIITGSAAFPNAMPKFAAYTASKYGVVGLHRELVLEYKRENITFNMILPTMVDTTLLRGKKAGDGNKPDNVLDPWELNDYYVFILSDDANRVNNELVMVTEVQEVIKLVKDAPENVKENWDEIKVFIEEKAPRTYASVRKLGKLIEFLLNR